MLLDPESKPVTAEMRCHSQDYGWCACIRPGKKKVTVLTPTLLLAMPFAIGYHGRVHPVDRLLSYGLRSQARKRFLIDQLKMLVSFTKTAMVSSPSSRKQKDIRVHPHLAYREDLLTTRVETSVDSFRSLPCADSPAFERMTMIMTRSRKDPQQQSDTKPYGHE